MPLSFVYQAFPEMLRPLNAVSPEVLRETREMRWRERVTQIRDDALSWSQSNREWKEAKEEEEKEKERRGMRGETEVLFISLEGQTTGAKIEETKNG